MTCPSCEYNKARAQLWRNEAYKLGGHPLDWEPELMVRPKPLPLKEVERLIYEHTKINPNVADDRELLGYIVNAARAIERAHGIGEKE